MTLGEFFNACSENPGILIFSFISLPFTALLAGYFGKGEGQLSPWKYLYSILIYLSAIPGIFAITLSIYMFFFERGSIMNANIYTQILPILSMLVTFWVIRKNVTFDQIPGFDKLNGLIFFLSILIITLWILEKTNIYVFTYMPFFQFLILFVVLIILLRFGLKRVFS